ncbi:MAG: biopolymer transporter ExbD [Flavobacteriales bacterium]|jgi:biopolymer transport protein ExbD|nr:biopolymer transporter ExbD [Flavobacteriales bacterium]MBT6808614.1 biopolymer transporter ExbD [Flavobacteriales bacterium]
MSKFKKGGGKSMPAISTASLPDIVFMLLFFFMVTTVMRETTLKVDVKAPEATEVKKMEKKSLVSYIYIGSPTKTQQSTFGTKARIQLNDVTFSRKEVGEIQHFINAERLAKDESEIPYMTTSIKADENVTMGIVTDVKQELRKVNALKINYSTRKSKEKN